MAITMPPKPPPKALRLIEVRFTLLMTAGRLAGKKLKKAEIRPPPTTPAMEFPAGPRL